ncbi:MAG: HEAT repeat domain-containing protein [Limisphaerales bacterium]
MSTLKLNFLSIALPLCIAASPLLAADAGSATQPEVDKLVAVLKSEAPQKDKADACRELARIGTKDAVASLAALLGDENLSHMARYGLETIPDSSVDSALREALGRLHGRPLVGVIGSIGVRRDAAAVTPLAGLLDDADPAVAQAAARSLGRIATSTAAQALEAALQRVPATNQLALCEGLLRCAEAFGANRNTRQAAAIYDHLRSLQVAHQVRTAAWRGAILSRGQRGLPLLLEAMRSDDFSLFAAAARISQELPGSRVTLALAGELAKPPADRQILLIQTLGWRGDTKALPALFLAARKCEKPVRTAAIRCLAELGSQAATPVLTELLDDPDHEIAQIAQDSLGGLPGKEVDAAVLSMLGRAEPDKRVTAIELIARRRMTAAVPALLKATQDAEAKVRVAAFRRVGGLAGTDDLPALLDLLSKTKSTEDLDAAEQSLATLCGRSADGAACVEKVAVRLAEAQPAQKCALLRVMASVGNKAALKYVRAAVSQTDAEVHAAAIRALAGWNTPEAAPDLLELARGAATPTDKLLCLRGYLGFAGHSDVPSPERLAMCRQAAGLVQSNDEKKLLLAALGSIQSPDSLALIQPYLDDAAVRDEAGNATVAIATGILQGGQAANLAGKLIEPLEKVAQGAANAQLAGRAKTVLEQARTKAAGK